MKKFLQKYCLWMLLGTCAAAQTPSGPINRAANTVTVCYAGCQVLSVTDTTGNPIAAPLFQFGSDVDTTMWGMLFTPAAYPMLANYTYDAQLGWPWWVAGVVPTELVIQQGAQDMVVTYGTDLNTPTTPYTLTIPKLPQVAGACPSGTYGEIAGGKAGMTVDVPAGTYRVEPATTCTSTSTAMTIDISGGNFDVLRTSSPITLMVKGVGPDSPVTFDAAPPSLPVIQPSSFTLSFGGITLLCTTQTTPGVPLACAVQ